MFMSDTPMINLTEYPKNPRTEAMIMESIRANMKHKGLLEVHDVRDAQLAVSFTLGARQGLTMVSYPATYGSGYAGWAWGQSYFVDVRARDYREGQLAIDVFDVETKAPAWHGTGSRKITDIANNPQGFVHEIVSSIMAEFPPR